MNSELDIYSNVYLCMYTFPEFHMIILFQECSSSGRDENETVFNVINVFEIPKFKYVIERKRFIKDEENSLKVDLYPDPKWKAQHLIDR